MVAEQKGKMVLLLPKISVVLSSTRSLSPVFRSDLSATASKKKRVEGGNRTHDLKMFSILTKSEELVAISRQTTKPLPLSLASAKCCVYIHTYNNANDKRVRGWGNTVGVMTRVGLNVNVCVLVCVCVCVNVIEID